MAIPWFVLPAAWAVSTPEIRQDDIDGKLIIESKTQKIFLAEEKVVYSDGVKATFGVTTVTSDTLTVLFGKPNQRGIAEGNVHVVDPEGTIDARKLEFKWVEKTGIADQVVVKIDQLELDAQTLNVVPGRWELTNARIRDRGIRPSLFEFWSPSVVIEPGKQSTARKINVKVLGQKVATLRRHDVSLSRKSEGLRLPSVSLRRGQGLGVTWQAGVPTTQSTYTDFRFSAFPQRRPSMSLNISQSLMKPEKVETLITPRSDLSELFNYGYMENINVSNPENARRYLSHERITIGVGSVVNAGVTGRTGGDRISKPWDIVVEAGGAPSGFAQMHQVRFQNVRVSGDEEQTRGVVISTLQTPNLSLGANLYAVGRLDGRWFFNGGGRQSKWGRVIGEAIWQPNSKLRLGIGYAVGANNGEAAFVFDRLKNTRAIHMRTDFLLGPTTLNMLAKYDPSRKDWFDFELALTQVAGSFEPYYVYRKEAGTSTFGVRFRIFETFDKLKDRLPQRTRGNQPLPPGSKKVTTFEAWDD